MTVYLSEGKFGNLYETNFWEIESIKKVSVRVKDLIS